MLHAPTCFLLPLLEINGLVQSESRFVIYIHDDPLLWRIPCYLRFM